MSSRYFIDKEEIVSYSLQWYNKVFWILQIVIYLFVTLRIYHCACSPWNFNLKIPNRTWVYILSQKSCVARKKISVTHALLLISSLPFKVNLINAKALILSVECTKRCCSNIHGDALFSGKHYLRASVH